MIKAAKDLFDIVKKTAGAADTIAAQSHILELTQEISELKDKLTDAKEEIFAFKKLVESHDKWEKSKEKYEKIEMASMTYVYRLKDTEELFCNQCFEKSKFPIALINDRPNYTRGTFSCPNCHAKFPFENNPKGIFK